jgi:hypothetical protein
MYGISSFLAAIRGFVVAINKKSPEFKENKGFQQTVGEQNLLKRCQHTQFDLFIESFHQNFIFW